MPSLRPRRQQSSGRSPNAELLVLPATPDPGGQPPPNADPITGIALLDALLDKAVAIPSSVIHAHVARLRQRNPHASPTQIVRMLERQYLLAVSTSGGAAGAVAAAPGIGTGTGIALTTSEIATFFATSSAFALAVAEVHGIAVQDTARRRTLLLATVLGEHGAATVGAESGLSGTAWARTVLTSMPTSTIKRVNTALARRLVRRQASRQGALAVGRLAPFGIGAVIGATGARALGRTVVLGAERAFGPPPAAFSDPLPLPGPPPPPGPAQRGIEPVDQGWAPPTV
ncbi:hypothetical protein [Actinotalea sp.]|uniref:hypothetical protein n=1 Tax=Actinotalea sp. TaxID=1872145 RepID=UPI003569B80B